MKLRYRLINVGKGILNISTENLEDFSVIENTSEINNDGSDGSNPFITLNDVQVKSVNSKTGDVVINKNDIGLNEVDNTSDQNKPISIQQQLALDEKIDTNDVPEYSFSPIGGTNDVNLLKDGNVVSTINLTPYLDDTNLSRITGGNLDSLSGIVTFQRDDNSTFTINLSELIDIQVQSDWEQIDNSNPSFIKNKPIIAEKTSELENDGGSGNSPYAEIADVPLGIEIRGVQNEVSTLIETIQAYFRKNSSGANFSIAEIEENFRNFNISGDRLTFIPEVDLYFVGFFGSDGQGGSGCTHFYDYIGAVKSLGTQQWRSSTNIQEIILLGDTLIGSFVLESAPNLTKIIIPKVTTISNSLTNIQNVSEYDFTNVRSIIGNALYRINLGTEINESDFPNLEELNSQDWFRSDRKPGLTGARFRNLKIIGNNAVRLADNMVLFEAPRLEEVGTQCFWGSKVTSLDFPLLKKVGEDNGVNSFNLTTCDYLNIPRCLILGSDTGNNFVFNNWKSGAIINVNRALETIDSGNPDGDLINAISKGAVVNYIDDFGGISVNDKDGIPQFKTYKDINIEGVSFDEPNKKVIVPSGLPKTYGYNTASLYFVQNRLAANRASNNGRYKIVRIPLSSSTNHSMEFVVTDPNNGIKSTIYVDSRLGISNNFTFIGFPVTVSIGTHDPDGKVSIIIDKGSSYGSFSFVEFKEITSCRFSGVLPVINESDVDFENTDTISGDYSNIVQCTQY